MKVLQRLKPSQYLPVIVLMAAALMIISTSLLSADDINSSPPTQTLGVSRLITPLEYQEVYGESAPHLLIDVRTPEEYASGHIPDSVNIPVESLPDRLDEIPTDLPIVVVCRSGNRSATAAQILTSAGYQPVYDLGGIQAWIALGLPVE